MTWSCWKCCRSDVLHRNNSDVCTSCHAALRAEGKRWCAGCGHAKPAREFVKRGYCLVCNPGYQRRQRERRPAQYAAEKARKRERWATDAAYRERDILRRRRYRARVASRPGFVTTVEAARALGCAPSTVLLACRRGRFAGAEQEPGPCGKWWIPEESLR